MQRGRDPAPPLTIVMPDALRLRHAPLADCARYDSTEECHFMEARVRPERRGKAGRIEAGRRRPQIDEP